MLVYLRNLPVAPKSRTLALRSPLERMARRCFESKGCAACHNGRDCSDVRIKGRR